jgi:hypothetical protein
MGGERVSVQHEILPVLMEIFFLCLCYVEISHPLSNSSSMFRDLHSMSSAWDWLWSAFTYTAMVNYPMKANFLKPLPAYPVKQVRLE